MNEAKFKQMLWKLEFQMRKAEAEGDAIMVAHYNDMIADLKEIENDHPLLNRNPSPHDSG